MIFNRFTLYLAKCDHCAKKVSFSLSHVYINIKLNLV